MEAWTCRFISVDPLASDYPFYTPYNYAGNKPINKIDIDGMQEEGAETAPTNVVKINGSVEETRYEVRNNLPVNAVDKQKMIFEFDRSKTSNEIQQTFEFNEKENSWYLTQGLFNNKDTKDDAYLLNYRGENGIGIKWSSGRSDSTTTIDSDNLEVTATEKSSGQVIKSSSSSNSNDKSTDLVDEVLSTTTTITGAGSAINKVAEETYEDLINQKPKYKSKEIPDNKTWNKIKSGYTKTKNTLNKLGNILGVTDVIANGAEAINHFRQGRVMEGVKSTVKAVGSAILMVVKNNPVVRVISVIWTIGSLFW